MKSDDGLRHTENQIRFTLLKECSLSVSLALSVLESFMLLRQIFHRHPMPIPTGYCNLLFGFWFSPFVPRRASSYRTDKDRGLVRAQRVSARPVRFGDAQEEAGQGGFFWFVFLPAQENERMNCQDSFAHFSVSGPFMLFRLIIMSIPGSDADIDPNGIS